jgi:hypothetical protein
MAVLPAAKAYPRGGAPRRSYVAGAPLYARMLVKFNGVEYPRGVELPVAQMSKAKHYELWLCGKADHLKAGPFEREAAPTKPITTKPATTHVTEPMLAESDAASVDGDAKPPLPPPVVEHADEHADAKSKKKARK